MNPHPESVNTCSHLSWKLHKHREEIDEFIRSVKNDGKNSGSLLDSLQSLVTTITYQKHLGDNLSSQPALESSAEYPCVLPVNQRKRNLKPCVCVCFYKSLEGLIVPNVGNSCSVVLPLVACTLWKGSATVSQRALSSINPHRLCFVCSAAQHRWTAGVTRPKSSCHNYKIRCDNSYVYLLETNQQTYKGLVFPGWRIRGSAGVNKECFALKINWMLCCWFGAWLPVCSVQNSAELTWHASAFEGFASSADFFQRVSNHMDLVSFWFIVLFLMILSILMNSTQNLFQRFSLTWWRAYQDYDLTVISRRDGGITCEKTATPVNAFQDCISTFVCVRPLDIFKETFWLFPGVFVATKTRV